MKAEEKDKQSVEIEENVDENDFRQAFYEYIGWHRDEQWYLDEQ